MFYLVITTPKFCTSGRLSDGGTFAHCKLNQVMNDSAYNIPKDKPIKGRIFYNNIIPSQLNPQQTIQTLRENARIIIKLV